MRDHIPAWRVIAMQLAKQRLVWAFEIYAYHMDHGIDDLTFRRAKFSQAFSALTLSNACTRVLSNR